MKNLMHQINESFTQTRTDFKYQIQNNFTKTGSVGQQRWWFEDPKPSKAGSMISKYNCNRIKNDFGTL